MEWGKIGKKKRQKGLVLEHRDRLPSVSWFYSGTTVTVLPALGCAFHVRRSALAACLAVLQLH